VVVVVVAVSVVVVVSVVVAVLELLVLLPHAIKPMKHATAVSTLTMICWSFFRRKKTDGTQPN
jgi:hypothetical protein